MARLKVTRGQRFGRLAVIGRTLKKGYSGLVLLCECDCGKRIATRASSLLKGRTKSCGCWHAIAIGERAKARRNPIEVGKRYGRLVLIMEAPPKPGYYNRRVRVRCDCGVEKIVDFGSIRSGRVVSCGCVYREKLAEHNMRQAERAKARRRLAVQKGADRLEAQCL
jgi:hypothetical protein